MSATFFSPIFFASILRMLGQTSAVTPLPAGHAAGVPETYPFGV